MFASEGGYSGYPDSRAVTLGAIGDLWDSGGAYGGEYAQRGLPTGIAHVVNAPNGLWLRSSPEVGAANGITRMPNGQQVIWLDEAENGFVRVEYYGTVAYAAKQYLELGPYRAGTAPAPIPPYEPPAPPAPVERVVVIDLDKEVPTPPPVAPKKSNVALYIAGAVAAVAAYYYL